MTHDPLCLAGEYDDCQCDCDLIAQVREDECESIASMLSEYVDSFYRHVGDLTCQPLAGDTCDMSAAVRVAVNKVKGRIKK